MLRVHLYTESPNQPLPIYGYSEGRFIVPDTCDTLVFCTVSYYNVYPCARDWHALCPYCPNEA